MAPTRPRGILRPGAGAARFDHERRAPAPELASIVEHYWSVRWDLDEPYVSEVLAHPSVHFSIERSREHEEGDARVRGVVLGRFSRTLEGRGEVFGIKLRPGAFAPFVTYPVSRITGRAIPLREVLGDDAETLRARVLATDDLDARAAIADEVLLRHRPEPDPQVDAVGRAIELVQREREILRVEHMAARLATTPRTLQRLFDRYVGVSPKWVIQRYRLHEATDRLAAGEAQDWARLAFDLGYFDQSHFIRDFKALIGTTPAEYAARCAADRR
ncbi:AraC family transcriptional regulator [Sandaracinus amylolyticus]|uniref:Transcriptional regulator, AraC family protein n=1 Tax=Sandaracinus amylolyticus TaxID=927083 RepID=A0A0F6W6S3_9BACT|nr:helix-turn-helix domain-containing protein [Sandaracinus amylolyticus]AKF08708.1 Transcriptional regulator, AraC family protein [Sandaracinus amylolyticus]